MPQNQAASVHIMKSSSSYSSFCRVAVVVLTKTWEPRALRSEQSLVRMRQVPAGVDRGLVGEKRMLVWARHVLVVTHRNVRSVKGGRGDRRLKLLVWMQTGLRRQWCALNNEPFKQSTEKKLESRLACSHTRNGMVRKPEVGYLARTNRQQQSSCSPLDNVLTVSL